MDPEPWIIVVNWNGAPLLPSCLGALSRLTRPAHLLVVDNGSTDESAEVVRAHPGAEWLPLGRNAGFAEGNNVGLRRALAAGASWIGMVNPDVEVEPDWLAALVAAGESHPEAAILGGLLLFRDEPDRVNSTGLVLDRFWRVRDRDFGLPLSRLARMDGPVAGVTGGAALLRVSTLRRIGLFDPAYFAYYEDADLSLRATRMGCQAWYVSSARAHHGFGKSFGVGSPFQRTLLARNHLRFAATHMPLAQAAFALPAFALYRLLVNVPLQLLRGRPSMALAQLKGAGAGSRAAVGAVVCRLCHGTDSIPAGAELGDDQVNDA